MTHKTLKWNEIFRCKDGVIYDNVIFVHLFIHLCYEYILLSTGELWCCAWITICLINGNIEYHD